MWVGELKVHSLEVQQSWVDDAAWVHKAVEVEVEGMVPHGFDGD